AQAIHAASPRADRPLVPVDMGTMADTLVESQLFGHEKGAFTGADRSRPGRLQEAMGGTLFIDELQNMTETVQRKMLLAVEKREIYPLGSGRARKIDVRILSATNLDLRRQVETAKFREDLFFRLGEFIIDVPPLRQRQDEIPELALKFIEESARQFCRSASGLEPEAAERLQHYSWPGNVRELKNAMKKAILVSSNGIVRAKDLDIPESEMTDGSEPVRTLAEDGVGSRGSLSEMREQAVRDLETSMICEALNKAGGNKTRAAFALKVDYSTLLRKIKEYGIRCRVQSET
ncbi:MAG: sigma 54-interacting transcriptional regulator, partial [Thermodesulfobacteriota bacterium]